MFPDAAILTFHVASLLGEFSTEKLSKNKFASFARPFAFAGVVILLKMLIEQQPAFELSLTVVPF